MPFWSKKKESEPKQRVEPMVVIMQSETLGMTVIEESRNSTGEILQITVDEWIDIIQTEELSGFSIERIYFSFLKGIPDFLRMKIWLLLCKHNNAKKFSYSSKKDIEKRGSFLKIQQITTEMYIRLSSDEPQEKQGQQIEKDIKRSFSEKKEKYRYLSPLLRKMLYASSNFGIEYSQGMNYIMVNILIYCLQSLGVNGGNIQGLQSAYEKDIFVIYRETIIRMDEVFGNNQIFKVMHELQQKLAESVPQIMYLIYKLGMDVFSAFSQNYFSVMSYSDLPQELCKQVLDLFFLTGQKAIHATIIKMLEVTKETILQINDMQKLQKFLKNGIYHEYYKVFLKEKETAKTISDFGLCFFDSVERLSM